VNVARASISGFEFAGDYIVVPSFAKLRLAYTWLQTRDDTTGLALLRRPRHAARASVVFTPMRDLTVEPILRLVGDRADTFFGGRVTLKGYARFGLAADYKLNTSVSVFARGENLTQVKYEDVYNFGTAGRSVYAGVHVTW
jgi:vitamin B12 transporter